MSEFHRYRYIHIFEEHLSPTISKLYQFEMVLSFKGVPRRFQGGSGGLKGDIDGFILYGYMHIFEEHFSPTISKLYQFEMFWSSKGVQRGFQGGFKVVQVGFRGKLMDYTGMGIYMFLKSISVPDQFLIHFITLLIACHFNGYATWQYQKSE